VQDNSSRESIVPGATPEDRPAILSERNSLFREKRYAEASSLELRYLSAQPGDAGMHSKAARTFRAMGNLESALSHQRRAIDLDPENPAFQLALAELCDRMGDESSAGAARKAAARLEVDARAAYTERQRQAKNEYLAMIERVLSTVLPRWKHATSRDTTPRYSATVLEHLSDAVPDWLKYAPPAASRGTVVDFGSLGRFRVGDPQQTLHKRLARHVPWELPVAALLMELASRCDRGALLVDVGANVGSLTVPMARAFQGEILAFEPVAQNYSDLIYNLRLNKLRNVKALRKACSRSPGFGTMVRVLEKNPGMAQLSEDKGGTVEVATLDIAVGKMPVGLMKMDVEGHESNVIAGAQATISTHRPLILCEIWAERATDLKTALAQLGYAGMRIFRSDWIFYPEG
jgi:FkbM family methyltransferase